VLFCIAIFWNMIPVLDEDLFGHLENDSVHVQTEVFICLKKYAVVFLVTLQVGG